MELKELQISFMNDAANYLGSDYGLLTKTELAVGYCREDDLLMKALKENNQSEALKHAAIRSAYYSALMLRYWYKIFEWQENSKSLQLPITDFVDWLSEGLYVAFYYKKWYYPFEAVVKDGIFRNWKLDANGEKILNAYYYETDPDAPDKIINRCCGSIRGREYQFYNKHKRKLDVHTYSYEGMLEDKGDSATANMEDGYVQNEFSSGVSDLIKTLVNKGEGVEALIVHGIANYDAFKDEKVDGVMTMSFDARKLVKHLNHIDSNFVLQFCKCYEIQDAAGNAIYTRLKSMSNTKLYKCIDKTLNEVKTNKDLLSCLV